MKEFLTKKFPSFIIGYHTALNDLSLNPATRGILRQVNVPDQRARMLGEISGRGVIDYAIPGLSDVSDSSIAETIDTMWTMKYVGQPLIHTPQNNNKNNDN